MQCVKSFISSLRSYFEYDQGNILKNTANLKEVPANDNNVVTDRYFKYQYRLASDTAKGTSHSDIEKNKANVAKY